MEQTVDSSLSHILNQLIFSQEEVDKHRLSSGRRSGRRRSLRVTSSPVRNEDDGDKDNSLLDDTVICGNVAEGRDKIREGMQKVRVFWSMNDILDEIKIPFQSAKKNPLQDVTNIKRRHLKRVEETASPDFKKRKSKSMRVSKKLSSTSDRLPVVFVALSARKDRRTCVSWCI